MSEELITGGLRSAHEMGSMTPAKTAANEFREPEVVHDEVPDFLLRLAKRLEKEDEVTDRLFHQKWIKLAKFYEGEHLGRFDSRGQWRSYQPQMGDPYYIHPELRFHSDAITASWTQSRPDIRVLPANDSDECVSAARKAQQIIDHYELCICDEEFLQREGKLGQFTGQMYRYTWWDTEAGPQVPRYQFGEQAVQLSPGGFECPQCEAQGHLEELAQTQGMCPVCGFPSPIVDDPQHVIVPFANEIGKFHIGDIRTEVVPAFQIKIDRSTGNFDTTTFLRRRRMIRPELLKEMFPFWKPPTKSTAAAGTDDFALRAERILQQSTGQPGRAWRPDTLSNPYAGVVVNQWWLAPCLYGTRNVETLPFQAAGGFEIKPGESLKDHFPSGLYLLIVDNKILDIRGECLHDHWQHSPFILIPTRVEGDGIEDLLEPARELDDLMSLVYIDAKSNAAPPTIVNTTWGMKTSDISGKPHWTLPARVPPGENIQNAVLQLPGRSTPYSLFQFIGMLRQEQQLLAKSFSSATGAPDLVAQGNSQNTATAAQLATSAAQQQRAPELALRAKGSMVWARQVLKLFQKNAVDEHYIPKRGRFGIIEGQYFKGADIDNEFVITIRDRSWIPRDEFSRRNDIMGFVQVGGLSTQLPRQVREQLAEDFNVSLEITSDLADTRIARMRLEQMKQLLPQLMKSVDPNDPRDAMVLPALLLQAVPLEPESDNHLIMAEWYKDWLKIDEGLMSPPLLRQAVVQRIVEHKHMAARIAQEDMALQVMAQAPVLGLQQAQQSQEQQVQLQQTQMQLQGRAQEQAANRKDKAAQSK